MRLSGTASRSGAPRPTSRARPAHLNANDAWKGCWQNGARSTTRLSGAGADGPDGRRRPSGGPRAAGGVIGDVRAIADPILVAHRPPLFVIFGGLEVLTGFGASASLRLKSARPVRATAYAEARRVRASAWKMDGAHFWMRAFCASRRVGGRRHFCARAGAPPAILLIRPGEGSGREKQGWCQPRI